MTRLDIEMKTRGRTALADVQIPAADNSAAVWSHQPLAGNLSRDFSKTCDGVGGTGLEPV